MKANELRIGNYYLEDMTIYAYGDTKIVKQITPYWFYPQDDDDVEEYSFPILLTEEWLIKFGFELDGEQINGKYYKKEFNYSSGYRDYLSIDDKGAGYMFKLTSNYGKSSILPLTYKYVHQLQNLYFILSGEELK